MVKSSLSTPCRRIVGAEAWLHSSLNSALYFVQRTDGVACLTLLCVFQMGRRHATTVGITHWLFCCIRNVSTFLRRTDWLTDIHGAAFNQTGIYVTTAVVTPTSLVNQMPAGRQLQCECLLRSKWSQLNLEWGTDSSKCSAWRPDRFAPRNEPRYPLYRTLDYVQPDKQLTACSHTAPSSSPHTHNLLYTVLWHVNRVYILQLIYIS